MSAMAGLAVFVAGVSVASHRGLAPLWEGLQSRRVPVSDGLGFVRCSCMTVDSRTDKGACGSWRERSAQRAGSCATATSATGAGGCTGTSAGCATVSGRDGASIRAVRQLPQR